MKSDVPCFMYLCEYLLYEKSNKCWNLKRTLKIKHGLTNPEHYIENERKTLKGRNIRQAGYEVWDQRNAGAEFPEFSFYPYTPDLELKKPVTGKHQQVETHTQTNKKKRP